jgi:hypothetical protein
VNLTENSIKTHKNTVKSVKGEIVRSKEVKSVTPFNNNKLQKVTATRPAELEPAT